MANAEKVRVLILCTGNSARSQMAEGILRKMAGDRADVHSAGITPAREIHPLAQRAMGEQGVDLGGQYPKDAARYAGQEFDMIITVCDHAKEHCPFFPGRAQRFHWSLTDPAKAEGAEAERLAAFRKTAAELTTRLREIAILIEQGTHQPK